MSTSGPGNCRTLFSPHHTNCSLYIPFTGSSCIFINWWTFGARTRSFEVIVLQLLDVLPSDFTFPLELGLLTPYAHKFGGQTES